MRKWTEQLWTIGVLLCFSYNKGFICRISVTFQPLRVNFKLADSSTPHTTHSLRKYPLSPCPSHCFMLFDKSTNYYSHHRCGVYSSQQNKISEVIHSVPEMSRLRKPDFVLFLFLGGITFFQYLSFWRDIIFKCSGKKIWEMFLIPSSSLFSKSSHSVFCQTSPLPTWVGWLGGDIIV